MLQISDLTGLSVKTPIRLDKSVVNFCNWLASLLPDDALGCRLRATVYKLLGVGLGRRVTIYGGQYIAGANLSVGAGAFINRSCFFDLTGRIELGQNVVVGHGVTFITAIHSLGPPSRRAGPVTPGPIAVGDGVWIGANVTVLPSVTIGDGAVVAAGALLNCDVPPNTVYGGVPAKCIREL